MIIGNVRISGKKQIRGREGLVESGRSEGRGISGNVRIIGKEHIINIIKLTILRTAFYKQ